MHGASLRNWAGIGPEYFIKPPAGTIEIQTQKMATFTMEPWISARLCSLSRFLSVPRLISSDCIALRRRGRPRLSVRDLADCLTEAPRLSLEGPVKCQGWMHEFWGAGEG